MNNMLTTEELLEELKKRGVRIKLEDHSCGCCGYTDFKVMLDDELVFEAERPDFMSSIPEQNEVK